MKNRRAFVMLLTMAVTTTAFAADSACVREGQHAVVEVQSAAPARVYFRSVKTGAEDYLDMQRAGSKSWAVLPKAAAGVESIDYRVATKSGDTFVTATSKTIKVTADCKVREFTTDQARATAAIVVGATVANAPVVPAGFRCDGIAGRISDKGVMTPRNACSDQAAQAAIALASAKQPETTVATANKGETKKGTVKPVTAEADLGQAVDSHRPGRRPPVDPPPPNPRRPRPVSPARP